MVPSSSRMPPETVPSMTYPLFVAWTDAPFSTTSHWFVPKSWNPHSLIRKTAPSVKVSVESRPFRRLSLFPNSTPLSSTSVSASKVHRQSVMSPPVRLPVSPETAAPLPRNVTSTFFFPMLQLPNR